VSIDVAKGSTIYSVTRVISGNFYPNKRSIAVGGAGGFASGVDATIPWYTGQAHNTIADSAGEFYGPSAVLGIADPGAKAFLIAGDSIANGYGDGLPSGQHDFTGVNAAGQPWKNGGGYLARALSGKAGVINIAVSADFGRKFSGEQPNASTARRQSMARYATDVICEYGRNDVSGASTSAQIQGYLITIWRRLARRGLTVHQTTITPKTTSTDSFMTVANQTVTTNDSARIAVNDWLRDGAPLDATTFAALAVGATGLRKGQPGHPLSTVIDAADAAESSRNSGKWNAPYLVINDAAMTSGSATLTSASAAFTSARDLGMTILVKGAGPAGADLTTNITAVNSATSVSLYGSATTTITGAQCGLGVMVSNDGTHPTPGGAQRMAAAIASSMPL
jgi:lysophospholipase L1-like esterase